MTIHLDNASTSRSKPKEMLEGIVDYFNNIGSSPNRGGYQNAQKGNNLIIETRKRLGDLCGIKYYNNLCFTYNATYGLNMIIKGFLTKGDHVIISSFEHNAVYRPIFQMQQDGIIKYDILECNNLGVFDIDNLEKLIQPSTKLIIANHASNVIGVILPIDKIGFIAKKYNIKFLVDLSQTAGLLNINIDSSNIDFFALSGHKNLLGPSGIGVIYIKNEDDVKTIIEGGTGNSSYSAMHPQLLPYKFEAGTINYLGIAGLNASLKYLKKFNKKIYRQSIELTKYLYIELLNMKEVYIYGITDFSQKVPIISFNIKNMIASDVGYILAKNDIEISIGQHCAPLIHKIIGTRLHGTCRISIGHKNTKEDIDMLIKVIKNNIICQQN